MIIGVVGHVEGELWGIKSNYMDWASQFGQPVVLSPAKEIPSWVDAVILPGGADVAPTRYGTIPGFATGGQDTFFESFDTLILPSILGKIPIFGICRGLQTINVALGGTLLQDISHPYSTYDSHEVHEVSDMLGSFGVFKVNSFHHQAIKRLGHNVFVQCQSVEADGGQGFVEAISGNKFFAVQWHPERLYDAYSWQMARKLFNI